MVAQRDALHYRLVPRHQNALAKIPCQVPWPMSQASDAAFSEWWEISGRHQCESMPDALSGWDAGLGWSRPIAAQAIKDAKSGRKKPVKDVHFKGQRLIIEAETHKVFLTAYEGTDLESEYRRMDAWLVSNKRNYKAFGRFANTWLSRVKIPMNGNGHRHVTVESKEPTFEEWQSEVMGMAKKLIDEGAKLENVKRIAQFTPSMLAEIKQYAESRK